MMPTLRLRAVVFAEAICASMSCIKFAMDLSSGFRLSAAPRPAY
jgi:hypothetical protein